RARARARRRGGARGRRARRAKAWRKNSDVSSPRFGFVRGVRGSSAATRADPFLTGANGVGYGEGLMANGANLVNPDKQIDCTGLFCPMPIVKTREAIRDLTVGQV